jgi:8-oxo-dGTP pyrophosphatase MutT (NUDIX family)/predicted nucleotidyltransferase
MEITDIINELANNIKPKSIYLYGSSIRVDSTKNSDIDILIVSNKDEIKFEFLQKFTKKYPALDLTILTEDEIRNSAHASFNSFYYMNLLFSSIHIYGQDILLKEISKFPELNSGLWRVQCIMQRIRNILVNTNKQKEEKFWFEKFNHWLYLVISEVLFLTKGIYTPSLFDAKKIFEKYFFKIKIKNLNNMYKIFSKIKHIYLEYPYQNIRIRPGVFVLIKNDKNEYLMLERRDGRGFEFVKGGVKYGEDFKTAAIREVEEELGININARKFLQLPVALSFKFPLEKGYEIRIYKGFLIVKNKIDLSKLKLNKFFSSAKLMHLKDAVRFISFLEYREVIEKIEDLMKKKSELIFYLNKIAETKISLFYK